MHDFLSSCLVKEPEGRLDVEQLRLQPLVNALGEMEAQRAVLQPLAFEAISRRAEGAQREESARRESAKREAGATAVGAASPGGAKTAVWGEDGGTAERGSEGGGGGGGGTRLICRGR